MTWTKFPCADDIYVYTATGLKKARDAYALDHHERLVEYGGHR
jgi:hypothetical protein